MMLRTVLVAIALVLACASPADAEPVEPTCLLTTCPIYGGDGLQVGDVENLPGGGKLAVNEPDPIYQWRLVNICYEDDPVFGGCFVAPSCPAPPDRIVRLFDVQYRLISTAPEGPWNSDGEHCVDITDVQPVVTPEMVQAEFEELPLPLGEINVQPADGPILVNLGVILFSTQPEAVPYDVLILGQTVHIDAYIVDYTWHLGDGSPDLHGRGAPYPDTSNRHIYTAPGGYQVTLTLTWDATYTVDGGPELQVLDTTTTDSPPSSITVVEAESILVDSFD